MKLEPGRLKDSPQITGGHDALKGLMELAEPGNKDIDRARAAWTLYGIASGAGATDYSSLKLLKDKNPRLREMAVRMLGRDCRENGRVQYTKPEAKQSPAAVIHLDALKAMANDPDAGVRRELILAFRNLPTKQVSDSLRSLTAAWDGQDRWYLEALGLRSRSVKVTLCRRFLTAACLAHSTSKKQARTAMSLFRLISRWIETRHSSQRERQTGQFRQ